MLLSHDKETMRGCVRLSVGRSVGNAFTFWPTRSALCRALCLVHSVSFSLGASQRHLRTFQLLLKPPTPHQLPMRPSQLLRRSFQLLFSAESCPALSVALPTPYDAFPAPFGAAALLQPTPSTLRPFLIVTYIADVLRLKRKFKKQFFFFKTDS